MSLRDFEDLKTICRVCLNKNKMLILLNNHLYGDNCVRGPLISDVLAYLMCAKVENSHPKVICPGCLDNVKRAYHLRLRFENSQKILQKYEVCEVNNASNCNFSCDPKSNLETSVHVNKEADLCDIMSGLENLPVPSPDKNMFNVVSINSESQNENLDFENCENGEEFDLSVKKTVRMKLEKKTEPNESNNIQIRCVDINKFVIEKMISPECTNNNELLGSKCLNLERIGASRLTNNKWKCPICNRLYSNGKLKKHMLVCKRLKITSLTCKECNKLFKKIKDLNYHTKLHHSPDPPKFPCKICGFICKNPSARQIHTRQNHDGAKSCICEICGKGFYHNANLLRHRSKHTKETQEVCNVCGKSFHYKGGLFYHMKIHTNDRKYLCNFCDKKFYSSQSLQRHIDSHTGDRRFKCNLCEKSFRSSSERRRHDMVHTGERPHQCKYCAKCFKSKYSCDVHMSGHRGEQPCSICNGQFLNSEVVNLHIRLKHKVNKK